MRIINIAEKLAKLYKELLSSVSEIKFVQEVDDCQTSQHLFQIRVKQRDELLEHLHQNEIYSRCSLPRQYRISTLQEWKITCLNAHLISKEIISLPMHLYLQNEILFISAM